MNATFSEFFPFVLAAIAVGGIGGLLAGIFGIGGGAVMVPVFYQALGALHVDDSVRMHLAIGTSLAIIIPTSLRSFAAHYERGVVDIDLLRSYLFSVPTGVIVATIVAAYITSDELRAVFAVIAFLVAVRLLVNRESWKLGDHIPGEPVRSIFGIFLGFISTLMGIGGGVINNTLMTLYGRPMHQAVATSAGVGVLISVPGTLGYIWAGWGNPLLPFGSLGYVNWIAFLVIIPVTLFAAPYGAKISHALNKRQLEVLFGLFLLIVAFRFIYSLM